MLYDSIIPCFGSRLTVVMMPEARRYRVFPLGTFHYFDWQKTDQVGISIGTCPQVVSSETAQIGIKVGETTRILPVGKGYPFADLTQTITPLTTRFRAMDPALPVETTITFRSCFYPQDFEYSTAPGYMIEITVHNPGRAQVEGNAFFGLPLPDADSVFTRGFRSRQSLTIPAGIDHAGVESLLLTQVMQTDALQPFQEIHDSMHLLSGHFMLAGGETQTITFYHAGYIAAPTLNIRGGTRRFGYTTRWNNAGDVVDWLHTHRESIIRRGTLFEATVLDASVPSDLHRLLSASFKGIASNAWWAEGGWFSVMEIGAYHSTLDVDFQLMLFFFQYWSDLVKTMLNQWAMFYQPGSGYMAHDVGQHLEVTGNRYGGPDSAMKIEENCNYLTLLHHTWRVTDDTSVFSDKHDLIRELVDFCIAADTTGSGLPDQYTDNTNDWGSALVTASGDQAYHGVRLVVAYRAAALMATHLQDSDLAERCEAQITRIVATLDAHWQGDHYPISLTDSSTYHHYSMWTPHGLLYALRGSLTVPLNLDHLRTDLIASTRRTLREHGSVHSTADVRGWLTQNLWRDSIAAYLGVPMLDHLRRYQGHGEYVSYEDTTILEVANELMVVPGAIADHTYAGQTHDYPVVDGHPRPACGFGLLYALAGVTINAHTKHLTVYPAVFPLRIALTHLADWSQERVPWLVFSRRIPNQDQGDQPQSIRYELEEPELLDGWTLDMRVPSDVIAPDSDSDA